MRKSIKVSMVSVDMCVAKHNIRIPNTDNFCTVSYYSEKNSYLTAFTAVEFTGSACGVIILGDKFLTVVSYVERLIHVAEQDIRSNWYDTIWLAHIVPDICNKYGGQPRKYKPTD